MASASPVLGGSNSQFPAQLRRDSVQPSMEQQPQHPIPKRRRLAYDATGAAKQTSSSKTATATAVSPAAFATESRRPTSTTSNGSSHHVFRNMENAYLDTQLRSDEGAYRASNSLSSTSSATMQAGGEYVFDNNATSPAFEEDRAPGMQDDVMQHQQSPTTDGQPRKKKITRLRPLRSCVDCNKRKIKCDRKAPCGPCEKRGEGNKCTLGVSADSTTGINKAILDRLTTLEARVDDLEAAGASDGIASPDPSDLQTGTTGENYGRSTTTPRALLPSGPVTPAEGPNHVSNKLDTMSLKPVLPPLIQKSSMDGITLPGMSALSQKKVANNDATEEAALALESLCRPNLTGQVNAQSVPTGSSSNSGEDARTRSSTIRIEAAVSDSYLVQQSQAIRLRVLQSPMFPSQALSDHLVSSYFRQLDPYWHVHINQFFDAEYADFWRLRKEGRHLEIDPAWLALYFVTLALGMQVTEQPLPAHIMRPEWTSTDAVLGMSDIWVDMAEEMLKAADWIRKPQVRALQAVILINGYQSMCSLVDPSGAAFNAAAVRIAQLMGYHELAEGSDKMPPDDPAVPSGNNKVKVQLARRLWFSLVVLEHVYAARMGMTLPSASTPYTTTFPANVNDIDLTKEGPLVEKPIWQPTSTSSLHLRWILAKTYNELLALPAEMPAAEKYKHVLSVDAELRKWLAEIPADLLSTQVGGYDSYKTAVWKHWSALADVHGQLLHLHRPYMVRGYTDSRFSLSTQVCLDSAKVICESRQYLQDSLVDERFWWTTMRWLSACIIIFIDLYQSIDAGMPAEALRRKKAEIPHIYAVFQARVKSPYPTTRAFAGAALRVVDNLLEAERAKHAAASRRNSLPAGAGEATESVGHVFQRIAKHMRSSTSVTANNSPEVFATPAMLDQDAAARMIGHGSGHVMSDRRTSQTTTQPIGLHAEAALAQGVPPPDVASHMLTPVSNVFMDLDSRASSSSTSGFNSAPPQTLHFKNHSQSLGPMLSGPLPRDMSMGAPLQRSNPFPPDHSVAPGSYTFGGPPSGVGGAMSSGQTLFPSDSGMPSHMPMIGQSDPPLHPMPPPISWDTSHFFHPDPSVLLRDMGYNAPPAAPELLFSDPPVFDSMNADWMNGYPPTHRP